MSELQFTAVSNGLKSNVPRHRFKDHSRERIARHNIAHDKLRDDRHVELLVGDGLDYAEGKEKDNRNDDCEKECPNGEPSMTDLVGDNSKDDANSPKAEEPQMGNLGILAHEVGVNISFVFEATAQLADNVVPVPEEGMDQRCRIGRKESAVGDCVGDR